MGEDQTNADYQRIKQVMERLNFSSDKKFSEAVGLSPQNLYDIKAGKKGITQFIADKIVERYPQFNKSYLMLGEGEMTSEDRAQTNLNDTKYIAHLEEEIDLLRKEKERLWELVQKLMK